MENDQTPTLSWQGDLLPGIKHSHVFVCNNVNVYNKLDVENVPLSLYYYHKSLLHSCEPNKLY